VSAEGNVEGATVALSSRFPPLDQAALAAASTAKFTPRTNEAGTPVAGKVKVPFSFKMAPSPVDRPCVEFTNELTEFARFNPGSDPIDMKSVAVIHGALKSGIFSFNNKGTSSMGRLKNLKTVWGEIVAQCTAEPQGNVLAVIRSSVKKLDY
jgi:TonB family protein